MPDQLIGTYMDPNGARHGVRVERAEGRGWRIVDEAIADGATRIVETLTDEQDGRPQAEAVARDYLDLTGRDGAPGGRTAGDRIPEQGGPDASTRPSPRRAHRSTGRRQAALPGPTR